MALFGVSGSTSFSYSGEGLEDEDTVLEPTLRIKQLTATSNVEIDKHIPLLRYYRSGKELLRMAVMYHEEKSFENAYVLYLKFMNLFLEAVSKHPEYSDFDREWKNKHTKQCKAVLPLTEKLKNELKQVFQKDYDVFIIRQKRLEEEMLKRRQEEKEYNERVEKEAQRWRGLTEEERRREALEGIVIVPGEAHEEDEEREDFIGKDDRKEGRSPFTPSPDVQYPVSPDDEPPGYSSQFFSPSAPDAVSSSRPTSSIGPAPHMPSRSLKPQPAYNSSGESGEGGSRSGSAGSVPKFDRTTKPASLLSGGGGAGLRGVSIPQQLIDDFMRLAAANTAKNVETCGVLAGVMRGGSLLVSHLLVPQQSGTADSCTTEHEEELFDKQDKLHLITLGWIHTHPSQTAFLSSVDLHTHCSYQLMMPEAVAVVCAPSHRQTAVFTLTPDHGLQYIAGCRETGFHPHPTTPKLFQEAEHVTVTSDGSVEVVDLRR